MTPPRSRYWAIYPLVLLWLSVTAALYIRPAASTLIGAVIIIAVASSRSFMRRDPWTLADHITITRLGLIIIFCATALTAPGFNWPATAGGAGPLALDGIQGVGAPHIGTGASGAVIIIAVASSRSFMRRDPWTLADHITITRLGLIIIFCAPALTAPGFNWPATAVGAVALALDGIDGVAARHIGTTAAGAVFDES